MIHNNSSEAEISNYVFKDNQSIDKASQDLLINGITSADELIKVGNLKKMPNYKYTALNNRGSKKTGILTASSEREARKYIKELQLTPISVSISSNDLKLKSKIKNKDIVLMTRQLATLLEANTSIIDALKITAIN